MVEHLINALSALLNESSLLQHLCDKFATWHTVDCKDIVHIHTNGEASSIGDNKLVGVLFDNHITLNIHYAMAACIEDCFSYNITIKGRNVADTEAVIVVLQWVTGRLVDVVPHRIDH